MNKRNVLNSPRLLELRKHRQRAVLNKILILLFGFLAFFILVVYFSRLDKLSIKEIRVVGNKILDTQTIKDIKHLIIPHGNTRDPIQVVCSSRGVT